MIGTKVNLGIMIAGLLLLSCSSDKSTGGGDDSLHRAEAEITAPEDGVTYEEGTTISFAGAATDVEDGVLAGAALAWTSDQDGMLGIGNALDKSNLSINTHQIILTATDSDDSTGTDTITIHVTPIPEPDTIAPAAITDFAVDSTTSDAIYFSWTAPGDDGNEGQANGYDIRYATIPLTDAAAWDTAQISFGKPTPLEAGTHQSHRITGLVPETRYYLSMMTADEAENWSERSNDISDSTLEAPPIGAEFEPNNDSANATLIEHEETQRHSLESRQDSDWFTFTTIEETELRFTYDAPGYETAGPSIILYDSTATPPAKKQIFSCSGSGCDERLLFYVGELPPGTYYVVVAPTGGYLIHEYEVNLEVTPSGLGDD